MCVTIILIVLVIINTLLKDKPADLTELLLGCLCNHTCFMDIASEFQRLAERLATWLHAKYNSGISIKVFPNKTASLTGVDPGFEIGGCPKCACKRAKVCFPVPHSLSSPQPGLGTWEL